MSTYFWNKKKIEENFKCSSLLHPHFAFYLIVTEIHINSFFYKSICQTILPLIKCMTLNKLLTFLNLYVLISKTGDNRSHFSR